MTASSTSDLLATIFPLVLVAIMGLIGFARGVRREAVVSAAIVLGVLIVELWGTAWSGELYTLYTGAGREWQQLVLSYVLLILVTLVVGYGLGRLVHTPPLTRSSRMWGLLLGLANGTALAGWLLWYIYTNLDGLQATSPLYQNGVASTFMLLARWFPVALAAVGALVALLSPVRRVQTVVAQPSPTTNWTPAPALPPAPVPTSLATPTRFPEPVGAIPSSMAPTQPYNTPVYGAQFYGNSTPTPAPPPASSSTLLGNLSQATITPEADAPNTQLFPPGEGLPRWSGRDATAQDSSTRSFVPESSNPPETFTATPSDPVKQDSWTPNSTPSWMMESSGTSSDIAPPSQSLHSTTPSIGPNDVTEVVYTPVGTAKATPITGPLSEHAPASNSCANCGAILPAGARFCTECGTAVTQA